MNLNRRQFITALGAFCLFPQLPACRSSRQATVAIHPWIGYETIRLAREFNWLSPVVNLKETKDLSDSAAALRSGTVDAACLTIDTVLTLRASGIPLTIGLVFDISAGADVVLARPSISKLSDLAGKRIGLETSDLGPFVLASLLDKAGLPPSALTVINCPVDQQVSAWKAGTIDAAITYEPTATLLQKDGAIRLFDSRQIPDTIIDVLAIRSNRAASCNKSLQAFVAGHFRGLSHIHSNRQDAIYRIAGRQGMSPHDVQQAFSGVLLPSLASNRTYLANNGQLIAAAKKISDAMVRHGLIKKNDPLDTFVSSKWLPGSEF